MKLEFDEDFVEQAVFLRIGSSRERPSAQLVARFNRERERLYQLADPDERNAAFFKFHFHWFRELGLQKVLVDSLGEFPLFQSWLTAFVFRTSRHRKEEGVELYINDAGERRSVLATHPKRLLQPDAFTCFFRHELTHLHDMLDPAFRYAPQLALPAGSPHRERNIRERYRMLWDVSIDGRLTRQHGRSLATRAERWEEFAQAFSVWDQSRLIEVFDSIWAGSTRSHEALLGLALEAEDLAHYAPSGAPGGLCPLCRFPTFAWASEISLTAEVVAAIRLEFPNWQADHGVCSRCVAIFRARRLHALHA